MLPLIYLFMWMTGTAISGLSARLFTARRFPIGTVRIMAALFRSLKRLWALSVLSWSGVGFLCLGSGHCVALPFSPTSLSLCSGSGDLDNAGIAF